MRQKTLWTVALIAAGLTLYAYGRSGTNQAGPSPEPLNLRQVALFKNGLGFFVGEATFPAGETMLRFVLPAAPSHGTFWLSYPADAPPTSVVARKAETEGEMLEAITIPEILRANVGRRVRLTVQENREITGRITGFTEGRRGIRPLPYEPGVQEVGRESPAIWPPYFEPGLVIIAVDNGTFCLNPQTIQHVTFLDGKVQRRFARTRETVEVVVQAAKPQTRGLTVSFLTRGITWAPSYMVDISGAGKARLSAKALIMNEVCDLNDVPVQLVTGFPHLQFKDIFSPMGMRQDLAQFLQALTRGQAEQAEAAPVMMRRMAYAEAAMEVTPSYGAAEEGTVAEDLFLYPAGQVSLSKGQIAYIPLFTEAVPYRHLYQWTIPDTMDESGRAFVGPRPPEERQKEQEIWHSLRLENTTHVPWTTAPAETVQNGMILGQDTLDYTPSGAETTLRITRALDVKAEQQEFEVERQRGAVQYQGVQYDLVTVRGDLSVTNFKDESITLEITKMLTGEVRSTDPQARIEKLATGLKRMNPSVKLTWTIGIAAGEEIEVTYTYEIYVRS